MNISSNQKAFLGITLLLASLGLVCGGAGVSWGISGALTAGGVMCFIYGMVIMYTIKE